MKLWDGACPTIVDPEDGDITRFALAGEVLAAILGITKRSTRICALRPARAKLPCPLGGLKVLSGYLPPCAPLIVSSKIPSGQAQQ